MHSKSILFCALAYLLTGLFSGTANVEAQELKKFLRDYRDERVFNYQATDPNYRGKVFRTHTGHYGAFYNCDGEENKRNSQYICWKPHHERDFPQRLGFWENLRRDVAEVKQRINDGGCGTCAQNCTCSTCQRAAPAVQNNCSCPDCSGMHPPMMQQNGIGIPAVDSVPGYSVPLTAPGVEILQTSARNGKRNLNYGLVSGKILQPEQGSWQANSPVNPQISTASVSPTSNSLLKAKQEQARIRQAQIDSRSSSKLDFWNSLKRR